MNGDNLFDLIIGQVDGTITYAQNTGTIENPVYNTLIEDFGGISVNNEESLYGFSTPFVFKQDNEINILIGSESGRIYHYKSVNNDLSVNFELISDNFQSIGKRKNTAILFDDFTNDGKREMFLGMQSGGLFYFFNDSTNTTTDNYVSNFLAKIYPNPSYKQLTIDTDINAIVEAAD